MTFPKIFSGQFFWICPLKVDHFPLDSCHSNAPVVNFTLNYLYHNKAYFAWPRMHFFSNVKEEYAIVRQIWQQFISNMPDPSFNQQMLLGSSGRPPYATKNDGFV